MIHVHTTRLDLTGSPVPIEFRIFLKFLLIIKNSKFFLLPSFFITFLYNLYRMICMSGYDHKSLAWGTAAAGAGACA